MTQNILNLVRKHDPLVHCITNYVTANDCANAILAIGGSPIMADDPEDVRDITPKCSAFYLNIGTLNRQTIPAMFAAGEIADSMGIPVLLDPVGAGASRLRTETAKQLIDTVKPAVIKGNISEISAILSGSSNTRGVEAARSDMSEERIIALAKEFCALHGAVLVITGATDYVISSFGVRIIKNGHPIMSRITGAGCMLGAVMAAFVGVAPERIDEAAFLAVKAFCICGERAFAAMTEGEGSGTYRNKLIDQLYNLDEKILEEGMDHEMP